MNRLWLPVLVGLAFQTSNAFAKVEYVCGSLPLNGSFWADAGSFTCKDSAGNSAKTEVAEKAGEHPVICMFSAGCTPATPELKAAILKFTKKKEWSQLNDEEINQATMKLYAGAPPGAVEVLPMSVQCIGKKNIAVAAGSTKEREQILCPSVNACVNGRDSSIQWKVKALSNQNPALLEPTDSEGFKMETAPGMAPRGVVQ